MDSQTPKLPEIAVEARRDEKDEKKRSGLLGLLNWLSKGGPGGFSGALGGAGLGGGLLATKAGLIGLILVGATLAGGIGVIGYKAFGPGSENGDGRYSSIFAQKTKAQMEAEAKAQAEADARANASGSLDDLAKANSGAFGSPAQPGAAGSAETVDKTKQDAAAIAGAAKDAAASAGKGKDNNTNIGGNKATSLKTDHKIGELSKIGGATGGGAGSGASFSTAQAPHTAGKLGAFQAGPAGNLVKGGGASRAMHFGDAARQLKGLSKDAGNTTSMQSVGAGFDGNGAQAPITGNGAGLGGAGETGGNSNSPTPSSSPGNGTGDNGRFAQPPPTGHTNVTPWQAALNTAMMLVAVAALLLYMIGKVSQIKGYGTILAYVLAGIAAAIGAYVIYLGSLIGGSFYGQHLQGQMLELAGTFVIATAGMAAMGVANGDFAKDQGPTTLMMLCGAMALGATAVAYLSPMRQVSSDKFKNGLAPDYDYRATDSTGHTGGGS